MASPSPPPARPRPKVTYGRAKPVAPEPEAEASRSSSASPNADADPLFDTDARQAHGGDATDPSSPPAKARAGGKRRLAEEDARSSSSSSSGDDSDAGSDVADLKRSLGIGNWRDDLKKIDDAPDDAVPSVPAPAPAPEPEPAPAPAPPSRDLFGSDSFPELTQTSEIQESSQPAMAPIAGKPHAKRRVIADTDDEEDNDSDDLPTSRAAALAATTESRPRSSSPSPTLPRKEKLARMAEAKRVEWAPEDEGEHERERTELGEILFDRSPRAEGKGKGKGKEKTRKPRGGLRKDEMAKMERETARILREQAVALPATSKRLTLSGLLNAINNKRLTRPPPPSGPIVIGSSSPGGFGSLRGSGEPSTLPPHQSSDPIEDASSPRRTPHQQRASTPTPALVATPLADSAPAPARAAEPKSLALALSDDEEAEALKYKDGNEMAESLWADEAATREQRAAQERLAELKRRALASSSAASSSKRPRHSAPAPAAPAADSSDSDSDLEIVDTRVLMAPLKGLPKYAPGRRSLEFRRVQKFQGVSDKGVRARTSLGAHDEDLQACLRRKRAEQALERKRREEEEAERRGRRVRRVELPKRRDPLAALREREAAAVGKEEKQEEIEEDEEGEEGDGEWREGEEGEEEEILGSEIEDIQDADADADAKEDEDEDEASQDKENAPLAGPVPAPAPAPDSHANPAEDDKENVPSQSSIAPAPQSAPADDEPDAENESENVVAPRRKHPRRRGVLQVRDEDEDAEPRAPGQEEDGAGGFDFGDGFGFGGDEDGEGPGGGGGFTQLFSGGGAVEGGGLGMASLGAPGDDDPLAALRRPLDSQLDAAFAPSFMANPKLDAAERARLDALAEEDQALGLAGRGVADVEVPKKQYVNENGLFTQTKPDRLFASQSQIPGRNDSSSLLLSPTLRAENSSVGWLMGARTGLRGEDTLVEDGVCVTPLLDGSLTEPEDEGGEHSSPVKKYSRLARRVEGTSAKDTPPKDPSPTLLEQPTSPSPSRAPRDAFPLLRQGQSSRPASLSPVKASAKGKGRLQPNLFIDADAQLSDEETMFVLPGDREDDDEGSGSDLDRNDEELVDDEEEEAEIRAQKDQLVEERYREDLAKDDARDHKIAQDAAGGKLKNRRRDGLGDLDLSSDEDEPWRKFNEDKRRAKKRKLQGIDPMERIAAHPAGAAFAQAFSKMHTTEEMDDDFYAEEPSQVEGDPEADADAEGDGEERAGPMSERELKAEIQRAKQYDLEVQAKSKTVELDIISDDEEMDSQASAFVRDRTVLAMQRPAPRAADDDELEASYARPRAPLSDKERARLALYAREETANGSAGGTDRFSRDGSRRSITAFANAGGRASDPGSGGAKRRRVGGGEERGKKVQVKAIVREESSLLKLRKW